MKPFITYICTFERYFTFAVAAGLSECFVGRFKPANRMKTRRRRTRATLGGSADYFIMFSCRVRDPGHINRPEKSNLTVFNYSII